MQMKMCNLQKYAIKMIQYAKYAQWWYTKKYAKQIRKKCETNLQKYVKKYAKEYEGNMQEIRKKYVNKL
jgi:hypothetical protein